MAHQNGFAEARPTLVAEPFDLNEVQLLDSRFKQNADRHAAYLLSLEPDRFLSGFRSEAGLKPKAEKYGGWESQGLAGQTLGHYISSLALTYRSTGDERFRERVAYIVGELAECQAAHGNGYVAAVPDGRRIFDEVARGDIRTKGFDLNGGWVPLYNIHKSMAGLRDAYQLCENEQALKVLVGLTDWICQLTEPLTADQMRAILACEFGGLNEIAADLYAITGNARYLALARRFTHHDVLDPIVRGEDNLSGKHANTQIPKAVGEARRYEVEQDDYARRAATNFWKTVVGSHTYVTGGNSNNEHFGPPRELSTRLGDHTTETCNTYNMLKLTRHLFSWTGDPAYFDYYENALVNHILGSQNPKTTQITYYVPLRSGARRQWQGLYDAFTCCLGTGLENHVKYGESIYFHDRDQLFVNLFLASELNWKNKGVKVRMDSPFPEPGRITLKIDPEQPTRFTLKIRRPAWATEFAVAVNGEAVANTSSPTSYIDLDREWHAGDQVTIDAPYHLRTQSQPDKPNQIAIFNGPVLLAERIASNSDEKIEMRSYGKVPNLERITIRPADKITVLVNDAPDMLSSIKTVDAQRSVFKTSGIGKPADVELVPFYGLSEESYTVYFDRFTPQQWTQVQAEYEAQAERQRELERRTVDYLAIGEMQSERDHELTGEQTRAGSHGGDRKWRDALPGGWFEFTMEVDPSVPNELLCTYWGSDDGRREFAIEVDGQRIATQRLQANRPGVFFDVAYALPPALIEGKTTVRVRFASLNDSVAGGCFGVRMTRATSPSK